VASPVVAIVGAAFMACCALAADSLVASSDYSAAETLLFAGLPAFALAQIAALVLGVVALTRALLKKAAGLPEALLGVSAAFLFVLTALYLLQQAAKSACA
jgi:hypothetical protein